MSASDDLTTEQRKRVDERIRLLASKLDSLNRYHDLGKCMACRDGPCGAQFEIWDTGRELEGWKQHPLQQIEEEDKARKLEDDYFALLISSYSDVLNRFVEIVERKVTTDDYGDEVISHLDNEISVCINKLKSREHIARFGWTLEGRLRTYLSELFLKHHANKEEKGLGN